MTLVIPDWKLYGRCIATEFSPARTFDFLHDQADADVTETTSISKPTEDFGACAVATSFSSPFFLSMLRGIIVFDISGISLGSVVDSAIFEFYLAAVTDEFTELSQVVFVSLSELDSPTEFSDPDYSKFGTSDYTTRITLGDLNVGAVKNEAAFNALALADLNAAIAGGSGIFRMGIRMNLDVDDTEPVWVFFTTAGIELEPDDSDSGNLSVLLLQVTAAVKTVWTPFPAVGATSPSIGEVNGVVVGVTDFSEFEIGSVLPLGITEYGISNTPVTTFAIVDDPQEGRYFSMDGQGFRGFGFGLDAFDGLMDIAGGELLARIWLEIPVNGRKLLGPAANMVGFDSENPGADFDHWCGAFFRLDPDQLSGLFSTNDGSSSNSVTADTQEAWQDGAWAWVRARRVQSAVDPQTDDDFFIKIWFGALADEPVANDGENLSQPRGGGLDDWAGEAIGWAMPGNAGAETEQRIAFLSFSTDPLITPPPIALLDDSTPWTNIPAVSPGTVWANTP